MEEIGKDSVYLIKKRSTRTIIKDGRNMQQPGKGKKIKISVKKGTVFAIGTVFFALVLMVGYWKNESSRWSALALWMQQEEDTLTKIDAVAKEAEIAPEEGDRQNRRIALTYDDGPHPVYTEKLLQVLEAYQVKATFFILGKEAELYPEVVQSIAAAEHMIGNHSYSHNNLREMGLAKAQEECSRTAEILFSICGQNTEFYRPPFGLAPEKLEAACDMIQVLWDIDTRDWECQDADTVVSCVLQEAQDGAIILMHDAYASTVEATQRLIPLLLEEGYTFVTVDELLLP
jgi:peptidoglycan/xylan/chitin deacetylase (PgdA/CDA1 family)